MPRIAAQRSQEYLDDSDTSAGGRSFVNPLDHASAGSTEQVRNVDRLAGCPVHRHFRQRSRSRGLKPDPQHADRARRPDENRAGDLAAEEALWLHERPARIVHGFEGTAEMNDQLHAAVGNNGFRHKRRGSGILDNPVELHQMPEIVRRSPLDEFHCPDPRAFTSSSGPASAGVAQSSP